MNKIRKKWKEVEIDMNEKQYRNVHKNTKGFLKYNNSSTFSTITLFSLGDFIMKLLLLFIFIFDASYKT